MTTSISIKGPLGWFVSSLDRRIFREILDELHRLGIKKKDYSIQSPYVLRPPRSQEDEKRLRRLFSLRESLCLGPLKSRRSPYWLVASRSETRARRKSWGSYGGGTPLAELPSVRPDEE